MPELGRPTDYTQEIADTICNRIIAGESVREISRDPEMPNGSTIWLWLSKHEEFSKQYTHAKAESAEADEDELDALGDEAIEASKSVQFERASAVVNAYKLKADNKKWAMSKKKPKKYGDKLDMTTNGKDLPIQILGGASLKVAEPKNDKKADNL